MLQSLVRRDGESHKEVQLWIQKNPFQITAVRVLKSLPPAESVPQGNDLDALRLPDDAQGSRRAVIWKTKRRGFIYGDHSTVLQMDKSITADFMGFGEQGGNDLFKSQTYMNYFSEHILLVLR